MVLWVILPRLPLSFYHREILEYIGDQVWRFIRLEDGCDTKVDHRWAHMQVEVNLKYGLLKEIELVSERCC
jgi:hypothetical protein